MLSSLHPSVDRESGAGHRLHPGPMKSEAGQDLYQQLQQKQQGRSVGQDLFLDLALHELDAANDYHNKRQSLPPTRANSHVRTDQGRPRSSGGPVAQPIQGRPQSIITRPVAQPIQARPQSITTRPVAPPIQERLPSSGGPVAQSIQALRSTPTPTQSTTRTPQHHLQSVTYDSPTPPNHLQSSSSVYDNTKPDWSKNPDMYHFGARRAPSSTFSEATPLPQRRFPQNGTYDRSRAPSISGQNTQQHNLTSPPTAQIGHRRSDPDIESEGSGPAPSTVWDELDDLKSRIRNLEVTGKAPTTSAATGHHSFDRPRTATTAPTTISSSPQHIRNASIVPSDVTIGGPAAAGVHPLLHSSLAKAKTLLSPQLYRSLESAAADALALAAMTGSSGPQGTAYSAASIISSVNVSERQIRRKAENMCRNLTDLCIALCEGKHDIRSPTSARPSPSVSSRFLADPPPSRYARRSSVEQEEQTARISPSRAAFPRLDTRRSSLLGLGLQTESPEPQSAQDISPSGQSHVDYAARYNRPGTTMRLRNAHTDEQYEDPTIRAPSRATTDVGRLHSRRSDYSTGVQPRSPALREALAARRGSAIIPEEKMEAYARSPLADHGQERTRAFVSLHGQQPASSDAGSAASSFSSKRRRRITSLEQYSAVTPGLAGGGGTPLRTTSLSRRRNLVAEL